MIPLNQNLLPLERSSIRRFTNLARQTPGCVMLTIGEPDLDTPMDIRQQCAEALMNNQTHYAPNQGIPQLLEAVAEHETRRGHPTRPEQVLITVGACGALFTAMLGILNPGEEVIIPTPGFLLYGSIAQIAGAKAVPLDISKTDFQITREALQGLITPRTKAIILNSPCNPTGTIFNRESLAAVKEAIAGKPIFLICDNVYQQLCYGDCPDLSLDPELQEQLILCQSFSKPYAMTGWRIGYLTAPDYVMERLLLLSASMITAVPTFIQHAAVEALKTEVAPMRELYRKRRDYMCCRLKAMGLEFPQPEGAFYVFPDISRYGLSSEEFCLRMIREAGLAAVPGSCFGGEGHIRLSYCYSDEQLAVALDRLETFLGTLG